MTSQISLKGAQVDSATETGKEREGADSASKGRREGVFVAMEKGS